MRGFVVTELAHPSKILLTTDAPPPKVGPNQVLIDVYSAGLNFFDILQTQGKYQHKPPLPFIMGTEFAGRRVFGATQGAFADKTAADWTAVLPLPDNVSYDQGAGLYITWPTSYEALTGRANLQRGEWVLVTAAAGGVGIAAVQLAKTLGARVIAAAGSQVKIDIAKKYGGAEHGVNYTNKGWQQEVLKLTGGKGVDVVYDPVGLITDSLKCIAWKGRVLVIGFAAGTIEKVPMNLVLLKNISIVGLHWGAYSQHDTTRIPVVWRELLDLLASGKVTPLTYSKIYPLERLTEGLAAIERRETWGKVIVRVKGESDENAKL